MNSYVDYIVSLIKEKKKTEEKLRLAKTSRDGSLPGCEGRNRMSDWLQSRENFYGKLIEQILDENPKLRQFTEELYKQSLVLPEIQNMKSI